MRGSRNRRGSADDATKGIVLASVQDCARAGVAGAAVTFTPPSGVLRYSDGNGNYVMAAATSADGIAIGFNVVPGEVTVAAVAEGQLFAPAHPKSWPGG